MTQISVEPTMISDGSKDILVTTNGEFYYGFGDKEPSVWHMYYTIKEAVVYGAKFGPVWVKAVSNSFPVYLAVSVAKV